MNAKNIKLTPGLHELVARHLVMLEPLNPKNDRFKLEVWMGGYQELMFTVTDLVKVCMLALEAAEENGFDEISNPNSNISGVLSLILNMMPYEEAQLLDILHQGCLRSHPEEMATTCEESYFLNPPSASSADLTD